MLLSIEFRSKPVVRLVRYSLRSSSLSRMESKLCPSPNNRIGSHDRDELAPGLRSYHLTYSRQQAEQPMEWSKTRAISCSILWQARRDRGRPTSMLNNRFLGVFRGQAPGIALQLPMDADRYPWRPVPSQHHAEHEHLASYFQG